MNFYLLMFLLIFYTTGLYAMNSLIPLEKVTARLLAGVNPIKKPIRHTLEKEFFIENRKNTTVERINERTLYVHENRLKKNESFSVVQKAYKSEDKEYDRYSQHTAEQVIKGIEKVAKNMLKLKKPIEEIIEITGLSKEQIEKLKLV